MKKLVLTCFALSLSGCATMGNGSTQSLTITTVNDKTPEKTTCNITNEEGSWQTTGSNATTIIHRDGNTMMIKCDNPYQKGLSMPEPTFSRKYVQFDLFFTSVIGVLVDAGTNAFYSYPSTVIIGMIDKSGVIMLPPKIEDSK
jgi:hypothetical protein